MNDSDVYAEQDMAHEFCSRGDHCDKWHCPFVKNTWASGLYIYSEDLDAFIPLSNRS